MWSLCSSSPIGRCKNVESGLSDSWAQEGLFLHKTFCSIDPLSWTNTALEDPVQTWLSLNSHNPLASRKENFLTILNVHQGFFLILDIPLTGKKREVGTSLNMCPITPGSPENYKFQVSHSWRDITHL